MYELKIRKQPAKFINKRSAREKVRIAQTLLKLQENPYRRDLDVKKLQGH